MHSSITLGVRRARATAARHVTAHVASKATALWWIASPGYRVLRSVGGGGLLSSHKPNKRWSLGLSPKCTVTVSV